MDDTCGASDVVSYLVKCTGTTVKH
jgi:hypothetical protein